MIEADELWSVVGSKRRVLWVWAVLDAVTRRVLAMVVGDRSDFTAECLWRSLPADVRERAVCCTDFLRAYQAVIPPAHHLPGGKGDGLTNHIERFWCTVRQRCGRFVRKTLSFSQCPKNHLSALGYFVRFCDLCHP